MKKPSKERQQLQEYRDLYLKIFDGRCIMCGTPTSVLHEIVPISNGKSSLAGRNRVPLCNTHHTWAHDSGTRNTIPVLQEKRREFLVGKWQRSKKLCFHGVYFSKDCFECRRISFDFAQVSLNKRIA